MNATNSSEPAAATAAGSGTPPRAAAQSAGSTMGENRLSTLAIILASMLIAVPVAASRITEGILDQTNPDSLTDLSNGLAYLGPILGWSYGALGLLL